MAYMQQHHHQQMWCRDAHVTARKCLLLLCCVWTSYISHSDCSVPRNALRRGYCNAAVVPSVRLSVCACVRHALPCEHDRNFTVVCLFIKLGRYVHYDERMNPIDFGGQRSKVKVTIPIYGNKLVNTIEAKPLCAFSSNLEDMLAIVRGWILLILEVKGQGHNWNVRK